MRCRRRRGRFNSLAQALVTIANIASPCQAWRSVVFIGQEGIPPLLAHELAGANNTPDLYFLAAVSTHQKTNGILACFNVVVFVSWYCGHQILSLAATSEAEALPPPGQLARRAVFLVSVPNRPALAGVPTACPYCTSLTDRVGAVTCCTDGRLQHWSPAVATPVLLALTHGW